MGRRLTVARLMGLVTSVGLAAVAALRFGSSASLLASVVALIALVALGRGRRLDPFSAALLVVAPLAGVLFILSWVADGFRRVAIWDGSHAVTLDFRVLDPVTRRPIPEALIRLNVPMSQQPEITATTDGAGRARIVQEFSASGRDGFFRHEGHVSFEYWTVEVDARGHLPACRFLCELTGRSRDLYGPPPPVLRIELAPIDPTSDVFIRGTEGVVWRLTLERDGRFTAEARMVDGGVSILRGAYARRGDRITFSGEGASGVFDDFSKELTVVPWGGRTYLVGRHEKGVFCAWVSKGVEEPRRRPIGRFFLRASDWEREVRGLPDVPEQWRGMLPDTKR